MNLNGMIKQFFDENGFGLLADRIAVIRFDGICLYSNVEDDFESASICALVSGLWQAAKSLNSLVGANQNFYDYRLGFDTTENGLYVVPFKFRNEEYFVCGIYKDTANPAKLKRNLRLLKENLEVFLQAIARDYKTDTAGRSGYLFTDISDAEIDSLFDFSRI